MLRRFSINFAVFSALMDALFVLLMLYLSAILRPVLNSLGWFAPIPEPVNVPSALFLIFPPLWVGILASLSIYDGKRYIKAVDEFTALTLASVLAGVAAAGILYFSFRDISRAQYALFVILTYGGLLAWRTLARVMFRLVGQYVPAATRRVIVVGTGPLGRLVAERLRARAQLGVAVLGFVDDVSAEGFSGSRLGGISKLRQLVEAGTASDVVIALPPHFYDEIRSVAADLSEQAVRVWIALGFYDLALYRTVSEDLGGLPLLDLRASALDDYERAIKRVFDIGFGAVALILALPLLGISALAILVADGAPVLFRQKRVGENGQLFEMLKLRTMLANSEAIQGEPLPGNATAAPHKRRGDPRVTAVGRVLRRFSIDEIPQLINVLRGEMSLVGPRPELPHLVEKYEPWQRQRLAVPPGMTGWWQITGRSDRMMHMHTEDDMYYVRNYSIWLDLSILVRTLWVVLLGKGAY